MISLGKYARAARSTAPPKHYFESALKRRDAAIQLHQPHHANRYLGSLAGLDTARPAVIQMNGTGYNKARNLPSTVSNISGLSPLSPMASSGMRTFNDSYNINPLGSRLSKRL